jgi:hypothetical protein
MITLFTLFARKEVIKPIRRLAHLKVSWLIDLPRENYAVYLQLAVVRALRQIVIIIITGWAFGLVV